MDEMMDVEQTKWKFKQCFGEHRSLQTIQEGDMLTSVEFSDTGDYIATGDRAGRVVLFEQAFKKPGGDTESMDIEENDSLDDFPWFSLAREKHKRNQAHRRSVSYKFAVEFVSHSRGFDSLRSIEIDERINKIKFCNQRSDGLQLLTTNDKTIKLWKVAEQKALQVHNFNFDKQKMSTSVASSAQSPNSSSARIVPSAKFTNLQKLELHKQLQVPKVSRGCREIRKQERKVFENGHLYSINGLGVNSDGMTFISSDDLRINLWDFNRPDEVYNIVDIHPENMEKLAEVITCCAANPVDNNIFVYSSSRGALKLHDLRVNSECDKYFKVLREKSDLYHSWVLGTGDSLDDRGSTYVQQNSNFFSEVLASISDVSFIPSSRYIISRDYLTIKIWDVNKEDKPVEVINFLEHLKPNLKDLYVNEYIFDKFEATSDMTGSKFATGTYNNRFFVFDKETRSSTCVDVTQPSLDKPNNVVPYKGDPQNLIQHKLDIRIEPPPAESLAQHIVSNESQSSSEAPVMTEEQMQLQQLQEMEEKLFDHREKALHLAMHPDMNCVAVAVENNLFVFGST